MTAGGVEISEVTSRRDRAAFLEFPWEIYRGDPLWVPPLLLERGEFIDPKKHPFYRHGAAALFLARRQGRVVGRIMAADDPNFNKAHGTNQGVFGLFESIDDETVAQSLLESAKGWLSARGRTAIQGPIDYSMNYPCGLLIDGFDTPPRMLMNHNPPYYARLLESWGLAKAKDLFCWWYTDQAEIARRFARVVKRLEKRGEYTIRPVRLNDYKNEVQNLKKLYNEALLENWGFVRMTDAEFEHMAGELRRLVDPNLVLIAEVGGAPVGFSLTLSDLNEALRHINGRLTTFGLPIGLFKLLYHLKRAKTGRLMALGVLPQYRRRGIIENLIVRTSEYGKYTMKYTGAELGWTLEDNDLINRAIQATGALKYKTYRIYEKNWGQATP
jgi:GNAT superfamily N-acetyltransferase